LTVLTMTTKVLTRSQNIGLNDGVIGVSNIQATKLSRSGRQALSPWRVAGRHSDATKMAPESRQRSIDKFLVNLRFLIDKFVVCAAVLLGSLKRIRRSAWRVS
jgi:hypothetical protein